MKVMKVMYDVAEEYRQQEFIETGVNEEAGRSLFVDWTKETKETRARAVNLFDMADIDRGVMADIDRGVMTFPCLVEYSTYAGQIRPYRDPVFSQEYDTLEDLLNAYECMAMEALAEAHADKRMHAIDSVLSEFTDDVKGLKDRLMEIGYEITMS